MNRDFTCRDILFRLNDRRYDSEFTPKYCLVYHNESSGCWREIGSAASKKEALEAARQDCRTHAGPFAQR